MSKRMGDIHQVANTKRKFGSADCYYHVRVEFPGGEEQHLLLTQHEVSRALNRAHNNPEDLIQPSVIRDALD